MRLTEDQAKWPILGKKLGHSKGYIRLKSPSHPNAGKDGYVYEHIYNATLVLGRGLKKGETVHHVFGDVTDNKNLLICTHRYHRQLHVRLAASPNWPEFKAHRPSNRPTCALCERKIGYAAKYCWEHYKQAYQDSLVECSVAGCTKKAGKRSGLCWPHLRYRSNKRRYHPNWGFDALNR